MLRNGSRRVTLIIVIVVVLYILNVLRIADFVFPTSNSLFFLIPTSTSPAFLLLLVILGIGGTIPIVLGIQRLFGRANGGEAAPEEPIASSLTRAMPEQMEGGYQQKAVLMNAPAPGLTGSQPVQMETPRTQEEGITAVVAPPQTPVDRPEGTITTEPPTQSQQGLTKETGTVLPTAGAPSETALEKAIPANRAQQVDKQWTWTTEAEPRERPVLAAAAVSSKSLSGVESVSVRMPVSPTEGNIPATSPPVQLTDSAQENADQKSDTFTTIYAKQKEYGQRVSELLRDLQHMANAIVQIPPTVLRSPCMAAYLTSDAVVLMFDRDRTMTTRPLRDFPIEVIVAVVAICAPKLKKSVLEKKQLETGKLHSLEGAIQELEEAKAEVSKEG